MYNIKPYRNTRQWYYRGSWESCNYSCSYCPFSKKPQSSKELEKDKENLVQFVSALLDKENGVSRECAVQIVPYGEALIHKYYWQEMALLSRSPLIEAVGAQTNLSFDVDTMIKVFIRNNGIISKLKLWCTFHPSMVTIDKFLSQCNKLSIYNISYCAGATADPVQINNIRTLRRCLPKEIYLWINKLDGLGRRYTSEEIKAFMDIDEYFNLELKHHKADISKCTDSCFIEAGGTAKRCNICSPSASSVCTRKTCSCYLSYCNQSLPEMVFFGRYPSFRIPVYPDAVFFDIDGTLITGNSKQITDETAQMLRRLSMHSSIFLATSLPYNTAMHKVSKVKDIIQGGVFAQGGMCRIFARKYKKVFPLETAKLGIIKENAGKYGYFVHIYRERHNNVIYKITLSFNKYKNMDNLIKQAAFNIGLTDSFYNPLENVNIIFEDGCIQIVDKMAGKKEGVGYICSEMGYLPDKIAVFGNSASDIPMLKEYKFSVTVNADKETEEAATYHIQTLI